MTLRVGDGTDPTTDTGPLVNDEAVTNVEEHVEDALAWGAVILTGGRRVRPAAAVRDRFFAPTILGGVDDSMRIYSEETFGSVAPLIRFRTEDEVLRMAKNTPYGLAMYSTPSASRLFRVAEGLSTGSSAQTTGFPPLPTRLSAA